MRYEFCSEEEFRQRVTDHLRDQTKPKMAYAPVLRANIETLSLALLDALNCLKRDSPEAERVWEHGRRVLADLAQLNDGSASP